LEVLEGFTGTGGCPRTSSTRNSPSCHQRPTNLTACHQYRYQYQERSSDLTANNDCHLNGASMTLRYVSGYGARRQPQ
jgi:hypothetical protein